VLGFLVFGLRDRAVDDGAESAGEVGRIAYGCGLVLIPADRHAAATLNVPSSGTIQSRRVVSPGVTTLVGRITPQQPPGSAADLREAAAGWVFATRPPRIGRARKRWHEITGQRHTGRWGPV
jgi:hypothetical protein